MRSAIYFAFIFSMASTAFSQVSNSPGMLGVSGGRFVFGQISSFRSDQYLLDTQTGRIWRPACVVRNKDDSSKCELTAMEPVDFLDGNGKISGTVPPPK